MQLLTCDTNVCKKVTIPSPSNSVPTPDIMVVVDIPTGLKVESSSITHGVINDNIWTIASLPPSEDAVLDICFNPLDCDVAPTGKTGNITISTTATESNLANNVIPFTLDYITCGEINGCDIEGVMGTNSYEIGFTPDSEFTWPSGDSHSENAPYLILRERDAGIDPDPNDQMVYAVYAANGTLHFAEVGVGSGSQFNRGINFHEDSRFFEDVTFNGAMNTFANQVRFGNILFDATGPTMVIHDNSGGVKSGMVYDDDYSVDFVDRSLPDVDYVKKLATGNLMDVTDALEKNADYTIDGSVSGKFYKFEANSGNITITIDDTSMVGKEGAWFEILLTDLNVPNIVTFVSSGGYGYATKAGGAFPGPSITSAQINSDNGQFLKFIFSPRIGATNYWVIGD